MTHDKACPSRRTILVGAAIAAGTVSEAKAQPTFKQADAMYQTMPKGDQHCGVCSSFKPPDACQLVQGTISRNGWCQFFSAE